MYSSIIESCDYVYPFPAEYLPPFIEHPLGTPLSIMARPQQRNITLPPFYSMTVTLLNWKTFENSCT